MKPVIITPRAWRKIRDELHKEYPKSILALRAKMKTVLGFTVREHRAWIMNQEYETELAEYNHQMNAKDFFLSLEPNRGHYEDQVHLDFYSENKRTMFLLKFSELINSVENTVG